MDIKSILSRCGKLEAFVKTRFGHFLNFQPDVFNSQLFHSVMAWEIRMEGAGQYELWFEIDRCKARFSKWEFYLITSLKFDSLSNVLNEEYKIVDGGIHQIYFNIEYDLLVSSLLGTFKKVEFKNKKMHWRWPLCCLLSKSLWVKIIGKMFSPSCSDWWRIWKSLTNFPKDYFF